MFNIATGHVGTLLHHRRLLLITTRLEIQKRYASSLLGPIWAILNPLFFLGIYLFVYLVIFRVRMPEFSTLGYVVYVFSGLVPFLALMETATSSTLCVKQNIHLFKNVIMPIDLIPARTALVPLVGQFIGLILVVALAIVAGEASLKMLLLPVAVFFQILMLVGMAWILAGIGVAIPDTAQVISLLMTLLMFLSPVAYMPDQVPPNAAFLLWGNPVTYMLDAFRAAILSNYAVVPWRLAVFATIALTTFVGGGAFFRHIKGHVVDYE